MSNLPKTKDILEFDELFIKKIIEDTKNMTIRNNPVSLGYKQIAKGLNIEVISCEKVTVKESKFNSLDVYQIIHMNETINTYEWASGCEQYGFNSLEEMYKYYKKYLKRDFAYEIFFCIIDELDGIEK